MKEGTSRNLRRKANRVAYAGFCITQTDVASNVTDRACNQTQGSNQ